MMSDQDDASQTGELLNRLRRAHDWKGAKVDGTALAAVLRAATRTGEGALTLLNAHVTGNVVLNGLGGSERPLHLEVLGCLFDGALQARQSRWTQLLLAKSKVKRVDLPRATIARDLAIEAVVAEQWLELRGAEIGGWCSLNGSRFVRSDRQAAVTLADAIIGRGLAARVLRAEGGFAAERIRVGGDAVFDGAVLTADAGGRALALSQAQVDGRLSFNPAEGARFSADGRTMLDSARLGALIARGSSLDGLDGPALVADEVQVAGVVDLSGADGAHRFEAKGALRFGSARIGGQFQTHLADLAAEGDSIVLHGATIGGDVLLGHGPGNTVIDGTVNLNATKLGGRVVLEQLEFTGPDDALSLRHSNVAGDVEARKVVASGPVRLDNLKAAGVSLSQIRIGRDPPAVDRDGLPEAYAHAADALLDLSFVRLETDIHVEELNMRGGDLRLTGARIGANVQLSRVRIVETAGTSVFAQSAVIGGGLQIAGAPDCPSELEGGLSAMSLKVGEDVTIVDAWIGTGLRIAHVVLRSAEVKGGITLAGVEVHGGLIVSSAEVGGDLHLHNVVLARPGGLAFDARGATVSGTLQFATTGGEETRCRLHGQIATEGATLGALSWRGVVVGDGSVLALSNTTVEQRITAFRLVAEDAGDLTLEGTSTALLEDDIGEQEDGWGAGRLRLHLDGFDYKRLVHPSGRNADDAETVREWRGKWLARRPDRRSARPLRHLSAVLRGQGLFEASRLQLVEAFSAEGRLRPTPAGRGASWLFGLMFGHGLSGSRAALTLLAAWLIGATAVVYLEDRGLLVASTATAPAVPCASVDPLLFSADAMLPLDLGVNSACGLGAGPSASFRRGANIPLLRRRVLGELEIYRFTYAGFQLVSWILVSLAVLTWSGLLKRSGRD